jgi:transcriptional regulator with XRE-family HTH domain
MAGNRRVLNKEAIREQVNRMIDSWQSYPDFAHFFSDLMDANKTPVRTFARQYAEATGRRIDVAPLRIGQLRPSYQFILDLADHGLLSLSDASRPGSDQRVALFAVAGFIEVTPESIRQWNEEVLAGWQRRREQQPANLRPTWSELMHKLLDFQTQGWRWRHEDIADVANTHAKTEQMLNASRVKQLLSSVGTPSRAERMALAKVVDLTPAQSGVIESAVEDGTLPLGKKSLPSAFSTLFTGILARITAYGITQEQLALCAVSYSGNESPLGKSTISMWKNGKSHPTLVSLRSLIRALEECHDQLHRPIISPEEIQQLVLAAGFSVDDLTATTHDIIARIDDRTRLKPLLSELRNAADLSVPTSAVDRTEAQSRRAAESHRLISRVKKWEREAAPETPTPEQVRDLLKRYNRLLHVDGHEKLSASEIQKVVVVARRERPAPLPAGFRRITLQHTPLSPRRPITPDLDDGPTR